MTGEPKTEHFTTDVKVEGTGTADITPENIMIAMRTATDISQINMMYGLFKARNGLDMGSLEKVFTFAKEKIRAMVAQCEQDILAADENDKRGLFDKYSKELNGLTAHSLFSPSDVDSFLSRFQKAADVSPVSPTAR